LNSTGDLTTADQQSAVRSAFDIWTAAFGITFTEITSGTPNIEIGWYTGSHGDAASFDGTGGTLAHAVTSWSGNQMVSAKIHFDDAEAWQNAGSNPDLWTVALHEIGHALGLAHSTVSGAIMWPTYSSLQRTLHSDDVSGILAAYSYISGPTTLCNGSNSNYSYSYSGSSSYTWSVSSGLTINSGQGTNTVNISSNGTQPISTITITTNNSVRCLKVVSGLTQPNFGWFDIVLDDGIHCYSNAFITPAPGATSYVWTQPSSITTTVPQNSKPLLPGRTYSISVSGVNACGTSSPFTYTDVTYTCAPETPTEIIKIDGVKEASVYPNPANNSFVIDIPYNNQQVAVTIMDMIGRVVKSFSTTESKLTVQSAELSNGLYMIQLKSETSSSIYKLEIAK
jgi:hypothetical protein